MEIPEKIMKKVEHGDISLIKKATGLSRPTLSKAFKTKKASRKTCLAIENFYKKLAK